MDRIRFLTAAISWNGVYERWQRTNKKYFNKLKLAVDSKIVE